MTKPTSVKERSLSAMPEPAGRARRPRVVPPGYPHPFTPSQVCLILSILIVALGVICWCRPAFAEDPSPEVKTPVPTTPITFDDSVKIAIQHSPYFTKSSLEIDIRKMDETDSRYGMVPPLTFRTYYYVNQPSGLTNKPYSLSFSTEPYNPFGSYFMLQAQKLVTKIAILNHLKIISKGLKSLGNIFLDLDALNRMALLQKDLIGVCRENLTYMQNQLSIGTGTALEVKIAQQELQLAQGEQKSIVLGQKRLLTNLKAFLGFSDNQEITANAQDAARQVIGKFNPTAVTMEQAKSRSYELKSYDIQKKVQHYNVYLATAKAFPMILFNTQSPDPLSVTTGHGLYVGFGLEIPVWDGFKRIRNISRQKAMERQVQAQKDDRANYVGDKFLQDRGNVQDRGVDLNYSKSREELARLMAHQAEVRYQSGEAPLPILLEKRKGVLLAEKDTVRKKVAYDKAVLSLREISGDLGYSYVDPSSWDK
jgi:outer membrane protein TolC